MTHADDVQQLLARVQQGDDDAAAAVFHRYQQRLIALARSQLDTRLQCKIDPEDVVQSVFRSYFRREQQGQLAVQDWDHLWKLLALITARKCKNARLYFTRHKRSSRLEIAVEGDAATARQLARPGARANARRGGRACRSGRADPRHSP